jgi:hypothetical protein
MNDHEGMTRMLFVDAIFGVGFPNVETAITACEQKLAKFTGNDVMDAWTWDRAALESLTTETLQGLYTGLKLASLPPEEVARAH